MLNNFQKSLQYVLESESGFSDNVADSGGATMKGITLDTYRLFKKNSHLTANDLKSISDADVSTIYLNGFWDRCRCSELPSGIDYCVFDFAINAGYGRSIKTLQKAVGSDVDGVLGAITIALVKKHDISDLIRTFSNQKEAFYHYLVGSKPSQEVFLKGWLNRIATVKDRALKMV
jgi:lysozyme family protein